jgi:hypothetical protein
VHQSLGVDKYFYSFLFHKLVKLPFFFWSICKERSFFSMDRNNTVKKLKKM